MFADYSFKNGVRGVWMMKDANEEPDLVVYYLHGTAITFFL